MGALPATQSASGAPTPARPRRKLWLIGGAVGVVILGCGCLVPCLGLGGYMAITGRKNPLAAVQQLTTGNNAKSLDNLVDHFKANGVPIEKVDRVDGGIGQNWHLKAAGTYFIVGKLDTRDRVEAEELRVLTERGYKDGGFGQKIRVEVNGSFWLIPPHGHPKRKEIDAAFKSF